MPCFFAKRSLSQAFSLSAFLTLGATSAFALPALPRTIPLAAERLYVPGGFDSNDDVEFILHGNLPSTCYKFGGMELSFDEATKTITVKPKALKYAGSCVEMLIPFTAAQKVGLLKPGAYTVKQESDKGVLAATLIVRAAVNEAPDDYLYAPVDNVKFKPITDEAGAYRLTLEGKFPYLITGCMQMTKVISDVQKDILVVQPVAEIVEGAACTGRRSDNAFSHESIVRGITEEQMLVHVRSLNGESYNRHFEGLAAGAGRTPE